MHYEKNALRAQMLFQTKDAPCLNSEKEKRSSFLNSLRSKFIWKLDKNSQLSI